MIADDRSIAAADNWEGLMNKGQGTQTGVETWLFIRMYCTISQVETKQGVSDIRCPLDIMAERLGFGHSVIDITSIPA